MKPRSTFPIAIFIVLLNGCGSGERLPLGRVTGVVTLNGRPLEGANVMFQPTSSGRSSFGLTDVDGRYHLSFTRNAQGALLGTHSVQIFTARDPVVMADDSTVPGRPEMLPARYNRRSELSADVHSGLNTIDFKIEERSGTPQ